MISFDPEKTLTREEASVALTESGYPVSVRTLARLAWVGGGPAFRRFRRRALYRWVDLQAWAEEGVGMEGAEVPGYREFMFRVVPQILAAFGWEREEQEGHAIGEAARLWVKINEHVLGEIAKVRGDGA